MEGRSVIAIEAARKVAANVRLEMIDEFPGVEFFHTIPLLALTQFGRWDEILEEPPPPAHFEYSNAIWHYARATAYAIKKSMLFFGRKMVDCNRSDTLNDDGQP